MPRKQQEQCSSAQRASRQSSGQNPLWLEPWWLSSSHLQRGTRRRWVQRMRRQRSRWPSQRWRPSDVEGSGTSSGEWLWILLRWSTWCQDRRGWMQSRCILRQYILGLGYQQEGYRIVLRNRTQLGESSRPHRRRCIRMRSRCRRRCLRIHDSWRFEQVHRWWRWRERWGWWVWTALLISRWLSRLKLLVWAVVSVVPRYFMFPFIRFVEYPYQGCSVHRHAKNY